MSCQQTHSYLYNTIVTDSSSRSLQFLLSSTEQIYLGFVKLDGKYKQS